MTYEYEDEHEYEDDLSLVSKALIVIGILIVPFIIIFIALFTVLRPFLKSLNPMLELAVVFVSIAAWGTVANRIIYEKYGFKPLGD